MFSKSLLVVALLAVGASASAPSIAVRATNKYYFSSEQVTFVQAWSYCKNAGMKFVSLPTAAQDDALAQALANLGAPSTNFWIGGFYLRNGFLKKWYWVDGQEDFTYSGWGTHPSPSITTADYCAVYNYSSTTKKGSWYYSQCTLPTYFICEI